VKGLDQDPARHDPIAWSLPDLDSLSREAQIVLLLTSGLSHQQIADAEFGSLASVRTHFRSADRKLDVGGRRPCAGRTWERVDPTGPSGSATAIGGR
jgi:DNA-binding NarL/FixJ family response regulator